MFSKNKKNETEDFENDPLADIYKSRKEKMQTTEETDMLKVNINDVIKEKNSASVTPSVIEKETEIPVPEIVEKKEEVIEKPDVIEDNKKEIEEERTAIEEIKEPSKEETMSNQEKIAKFISDYHNRARHYNAEKLLKGIDEIVDKSGNIIETSEKKEEEKVVNTEIENKEKVSDDTTVFMAKDEILEKVSTKELDSHEVNELVKNMAVEEEHLKSQETQIIDLNNKDEKEDIEVKEEEKVEQEVTEQDEKIDNEVSTEIESTEPPKIEYPAFESNTEPIINTLNIDTDDVSEDEDEIDIDNPYAFHIGDLDKKDTTAPIENVNVSSNVSHEDDSNDSLDVNENADAIENKESDSDYNSETEKVKNKIFAKAKDEIEKFTSFAGGLLSSKIDNQNTELIDTKKVRDAIDKSNNKPSKDDFPGFAEMYKKTFGVEPFSIRKERKIIEQEKEKYNATSEFSYANENINIFENNDEEDEEKQEIQYKFIGQAFGNYVVIELKSEMYVIDVSACKRRLIYEDLKEKYYNDEEEGQMLLLPDVIILSRKELKLAQENVEMFEKAGFKYESFGENTIKLITVPSVCEELNTKQLFVEILDNLDTVAIIDTKEKEEKFLSIIALKIATNEIVDVDEEQSQKMLTKLLKYDSPFTSPDGKPIAIKMTKNDLDKKFSRR